jgi:hypothetical protein
MPISGFFTCSTNNRVDSQIDILIDRLCTERDRGGRVSFLPTTPEKIKKCAAGYTNFNLIELGQYEFNVVRALARNFSNPRLVFN